MFLPNTGILLVWVSNKFLILLPKLLFLCQVVLFKVYNLVLTSKCSKFMWCFGRVSIDTSSSLSLFLAFNLNAVNVMFWFFIFANFCCSDVGMFQLMWSMRTLLFGLSVISCCCVGRCFELFNIRTCATQGVSTVSFSPELFIVFPLCQF